MGKEDKERQKAEIELQKAEKLMDNSDWKNSAEKFQKAGEKFFELGEWKIAEQCFLYASKGLLKINKFHGAASLQRLSANCCLLQHEFAKARDYYDVCMKNSLKSDNNDRYDIATTAMCFAFLCHFILGQQDEALGYVKKFRDEIDPAVFSSHVLVQLVKNLSNAIVNENEKYLQDVLNEYPKFKFRAAEAELIRAGILVAMCSIMMHFSIETKETEFVKDEIVEIRVKLDFNRMKEIQQNRFLPHKFESIIVENIAYSIGDNISLKEQTNFPISLNLNNLEKDGTLPMFLKFRTNFPGEGFIGPIMITVELDKKFHFFLKTEVKKIKVISPKAVIGVNLTPQKTPVVNQTFPLQVEIFNQSEGEAVEIKILFEFPESLKMMRGTFEKTIFSLRPNEQFKWEIQLKAIEAGDIPLKTIVQFKDGNGNDKGPFTAEMPITINL